jgi:diketogulonate reductase-like aldo/keto reductase
LRSPCRLSPAAEGCASSQLALAWAAAQCLIAIPGTTKAPRMAENWAARDIDLSEDEVCAVRRAIEENRPYGNCYPPAMRAKVGH